MTSARQRVQVLLVSMPFGELHTPSIGLSLLRAGLTRSGFSTKILYLNIGFAKVIGSQLYDEIAALMGQMEGEWLFSRSLYGEAPGEPEEYTNGISLKQSSAYRRVNASKPNALAEYIGDCLAARDKVDAFLDECLAAVCSYDPDIAGFTSVCQQQVASLALAKRLKARMPDVFTVFGGPSYEGIMGAEVVRQHPFVDAVVSGEGDIVFPELARRVLNGAPISDLQGVYTRENADRLIAEGRCPNAPLVMDMDSLPVPEYDDYFEQRSAACLDRAFETWIPFETSRGCWWAEKARCTFCALNGADVRYRSKSPDRALDELSSLMSRYRPQLFVACDSVLNNCYFDNLIPTLCIQPLGAPVFYEVRSDLTKHQVRFLRQAGITHVQPGIESLSTKVLRLMHKGVTALQNIQFLKSCEELGVDARWNLLWGFPGEPPDEYARMAALIPMISHLRPPVAAHCVVIQRFSLFYENPERFGFADVRAPPIYNHIYPFSPDVIANLAYHFAFRYRDGRDVESYTNQVKQAWEKWKTDYRSNSRLIMVDHGSHLIIWDLRSTTDKRTVALKGLEKLLYLACDSIQSIGRLRRLAMKHCGREMSELEIEETLQRFVDDGLMIREGNQYLSLAVPSSLNSMDSGDGREESRRPMQAVLREV